MLIQNMSNKSKGDEKKEMQLWEIESLKMAAEKNVAYQSPTENAKDLAILLELCIQEMARLQLLHILQ